MAQDSPNHPANPAHRAIFESYLAEHLEAVSRLETVFPLLDGVVEACIQALQGGGKILTCGNGGSAADAQHFAAELTGRYRRERRPLAALALTTDSSALTCIGNDYAFEEVFARQVTALGKAGDVLVGISTSGRSANVLRALEAGKAAGLITVALVGSSGGSMKGLADHCIAVPASATARIQEMHILLIHMICESIDQWVLGGPNP